MEGDERIATLGRAGLSRHFEVGERAVHVVKRFGDQLLIREGCPTRSPDLRHLLRLQ
jgi:hypothetical protein